MNRKISISLFITFSLLSSTFCSMVANRYMDENLPSGFGCINVSSDLTSLSGTITVAGHLDYYDNKGDKQPLVWARVWICDREPDGNDYIHKEIFTDIEGNFTSGPIDNDDDPDEDGLDIWIYVVAWNWATQVINENGIRYYARTHMRDDWPDGTYYMTGEIPEGHGAWMIFSYHCGIATGWNYLDTTVDYEMPMATACWPCGDWPCYNPNNGVINLTDWSAWYPDIILHEYGHYVMHTLYGYMPPAMEEHYINETSDASTAWVEGWANFFPLVVQNDTDLLGWNLETPHWCSAGWDDGDEVEGRVAGALWDIYDSDDDGYDSFSDGFTRIWNIMDTNSCDTFHEFWQAWNTSGYQKQPALMAIFQNTIDYRGPGDANGDCIVEMMDFYVLTAAFGSEKGDSHWDQRADLNFDGIVELMDFLIVSQNYGNKYDC